jgi:hypothetical protein
MFRNKTLKDLLKIAKKEKVQVIYFDAYVFFMPGKQFDINKVNYYRRYKSYGYMTGKDLFSSILMNEQFSDSACLMMINRVWLYNNKIKFIEGIIYEDCIFSIQVMMKAIHTYHINEQFYIYRVRNNSIMNTKIQPINLYSRIINYKELIKIYINNKFTDFQQKAILSFINIIKNEIIYFNKLFDENEWRIFCRKKFVSNYEKILLHFTIKFETTLYNLINFWKLLNANKVEIYGIQDNKLIEFYNIINKTEIIKGFINYNKKLNISSINGKTVRYLKDDNNNIDKHETIIILAKDINIKNEKYKLKNCGYNNIIILDENFNRILAKLIIEIIKQKYSYPKYIIINFFIYNFL